jgi:hypothetical protein
VGVQSQQDWAMGRVNIKRRRKKSKKSWHRASCEAQFLRENQPKAKIRQRLIRHKVINT